MTTNPYQGYLAAFVSALADTGCLRSEWIRRALLQAPRHRFIEQYYDFSAGGEVVVVDPDRPTESQLQTIYSDRGLMLRTSPHSAASQPSLIVSMLEALDVESGQHVLEIGTGSGWNVALLACGVGAEGRACSVDIQPDLVEAAARHLAAVGLPADLLAADGALGWPERAPFDRIVVTVGSPDIAPAWGEQLADGGVLLLPLKTSGLGDPLLRLHKSSGRLTGAFVGGAGFMTIEGLLGTDAHNPLWPPWESPIDQALAGEPRRVTVPEPLGPDFLLFAYLNGRRFRTMHGLEGRFESAFVLRDPKRRAVYVAREHEPVVEVYGDDAGLEGLLALHQEWAARGQPRLNDYRVTVLEPGAPPAGNREWTDQRPHVLLHFRLE